MHLDKKIYEVEQCRSYIISQIHCHQREGECVLSRSQWCYKCGKSLSVQLSICSVQVCVGSESARLTKIMRDSNPGTSRLSFCFAFMQRLWCSILCFKGCILTFSPTFDFSCWYKNNLNNTQDIRIHTCSRITCNRERSVLQVAPISTRPPVSGMLGIQILICPLWPYCLCLRRSPSLPSLWSSSMRSVALVQSHTHTHTSLSESALCLCMLLYVPDGTDSVSAALERRMEHSQCSRRRTGEFVLSCCL